MHHTGGICGVQRAGRLVREHQIRLGKQLSRQGNTLLLSSGQLPNAGIEVQATHSDAMKRIPYLLVAFIGSRRRPPTCVERFSENAREAARWIQRACRILKDHSGPTPTRRR